MKPPNPDVATANYGTIIEIHPVSKAGAAWLRRHCRIESWQRRGKGFACDPRAALDLMHAMLDAGLCISDAGTGRLAWRVREAKAS